MFPHSVWSSVLWTAHIIVFPSIPGNFRASSFETNACFLNFGYIFADYFQRFFFTVLDIPSKRFLLDLYSLPLKSAVFPCLALEQSWRWKPLYIVSGFLFISLGPVRLQVTLTTFLWPLSKFLLFSFLGAAFLTCRRYSSLVFSSAVLNTCNSFAFY